MKINHRTDVIDKYWALRNVIANQALEALIMTEDDLERCLKIVYGELSTNDAIAKIHQELAEDRCQNPLRRNITGPTSPFGTCQMR